MLLLGEAKQKSLMEYLIYSTRGQFKIHKVWFFLLLFLFGSASLTAQDEYERLAAIISLDSFTVTATRAGFDVEDFIEIVREDESFYEAFKNLRFLSYDSENDIQLFDKKSKLVAQYTATTHQAAANNCREVFVETETVKGNYFKRKRKLRYYTAKLYDRLFFSDGLECESATADVSRGMEKHVDQLKRLIFQPGEPVNVPIVGKKTAIFEEDLIELYDFSIQSKSYKNQIDCYVFTARVKPAVKEDKTIIKYLETYFDKTSFQVIARNYQLKYFGAAFDFDVKMDIKLRKLGQQYVPEYLSYDGFWNIPTQKPETATFSTTFYNFE